MPSKRSKGTERSRSTDLRTAIDIETIGAVRSESETGKAILKAALFPRVASGSVARATLSGSIRGVLVDLQQDAENLVLLLLRQAFREPKPQTAVVQGALDTLRLCLHAQGHDVVESQEHKYDKSGELHGDNIAIILVVNGTHYVKFLVDSQEDLH